MGRNGGTFFLRVVLFSVFLFIRDIFAGFSDSLIVEVCRFPGRFVYMELKDVEPLVGSCDIVDSLCRDFICNVAVGVNNSFLVVLNRWAARLSVRACDHGEGPGLVVEPFL